MAISPFFGNSSTDYRTENATHEMGRTSPTNESLSFVCLGPSFFDEGRLRAELTKMGIEPAEDHAFRSPYIITPRVCVDPGSVRPPVPKVTRRTKIISCFNCPRWYREAKLNQKNLDFRACAYSQCTFDVTGKLKNEADVLIFFTGDLENIPVPSRPLGQVWVKAFFESPVHYGYPANYEAWKSVFNWTFTYRTDSDIFAPSTLLAWRDKRLLYSYDQYLNFAKNKTKTAAWFVSHCDTQSKREEYVKEMQKYIDVDIYGACGKLKCPRSARDQCEAMLNHTYKFYLSFENSFCFDYVTEKVMQRLADRSQVVPVVRGGFNYTRYFPPGWYVNAADFRSAKDLALHLKELGNDHRKYASMLREKDRLVTLGYKNDYCNLCEKVHRSTGTKIIPDIKQWSHADRSIPKAYKKIYKQNIKLISDILYCEFL
ncbi:hypothetical protein Btru_062655 [Bulinus truncatus]|nr:hypothetical protein Btru_062655 [Bulinus truncatus]